MRTTGSSPAGTARPAGKADQRSLELEDGQLLTLPAKPERIVSLVLAADDVLLEIVEPSRVLALSSMSTDPRYSLSAAAAAQLGRTVPSHAEPVLALRPDLVFAAGYTTAETLERLQSAGAPVLRLSQYDSLDEIRANIRLIGRAVGESEKAERLVERLDEDLETARARMPSSPVRVLGWWSGSVLGSETLFDDVLSQLGAVNVAAEAGLRGWPRVSLESIVAWRPDVVLLDAEAGSEAAMVERLSAEPVIARSGLVERGAIVAVPSATVSSVSHHVGRFALGLSSLLADAVCRPANRVARSVECQRRRRLTTVGQVTRRPTI